jgi:hypothetical protein
VDIPLLLAGPILRRVEPTVVSVWLALSKPATVRLILWEGRVLSGSGNPLFSNPAPGVKTLRVGAKLHIAQVTLAVPANSTATLQPDRVYSYDVEVNVTGGGKHTLQSLHLLETGADHGVPRAPLGYDPGFLPSFSAPPSDIGNLKILYGSCRRPAHPDPDAMVWIDDIIQRDDAYKDGRRRPHQLFLGGDQIYADDVTRLHMLLLMELGQELVGRNSNGTSLERLRVDEVLKKSSLTHDPKDPLKSYDDAPATADRELPADRAHFPEGERLHLTRRAAQMTSVDGDSHLLSFGEFAAMYLSVWSMACWGDGPPGARVGSDPLLWLPEGVKFSKTQTISVPELEFADFWPKHLFRDPSEIPPADPDTRSEAEKQKDEAKAAADRQKSLRGQLRVLSEFRRGLPKVQRALANVPTYMIFDDHDVTDDWYLNQLWRDRVLTNSLGVTTIRNALLSYALFQAWGNDPAKFEKSEPHHAVLTEAEKIFLDGAPGPAVASAAKLDKLFGFDLRGTPQIDGSVAATKPPVTWHFSVDGPKHRVIAIDNRTRRSYASVNGPPGNVGGDAQVEQIPAPPLPQGMEVLLVVAPLQVFGPPLLDEVVAPLTYRVFDAIEATQKDSPVARTESRLGLRGMVGTNPDAIEAWAFDAVTFEAFLKRLEPYKRVVLLSGDVHYSASAEMSYWKGTAQQPTRFAQFTSSGFKNVMPVYIRAVDRSLGFAQQMVRSLTAIERLGWDRPQENLILLPSGASEHDLVPVMRARLKRTPVMVPTWGWPDKNKEGERDPAKASRLNAAFPPDWRWRAKGILDKRPDAERPAPERPTPLDLAAIDAKLKSPQAIEAYSAIAARHQDALSRLKNARQILFRSNFGLVRFEKKGDALDAIHEVYTAFDDPDAPSPTPARPEAYMVHVASLGPLNEEPPSKLRTKVVEPPPPNPSPGTP